MATRNGCHPWPRKYFELQDKENAMRRFITIVFMIAILCGGMLAALTSGLAVAAEVDKNAERAVTQADHALFQAIAKADKSGFGKLLDADLIWTDSQGKSQTKAEVLQNLPAPGNSGLELPARIYGGSAVIRGGQGRLQVLRVWARRPAGWRLLLYQEVMLAEKPRPVPNANVNAGPCENPCKTIPYQPKTETEKAALAAMQAVQAAMANNDPNSWAANVADEFTATNSPDNEVYGRTNRLEQFNNLIKAGLHTTPTPMVSARVFDLGGAVLIVPHEQPPTNKTNLNTRLMIKQNGRWVMLFSFNTRIEASQAPAHPTAP
jgi:hypothetical protein